MKKFTGTGSSGLIFWAVFITIGFTFYIINETQNTRKSGLEQQTNISGGAENTAAEPVTAQAPKRISDLHNLPGRISLPFSRLIRTAPVNDIIIDPRGEVWAATEKGIVSISSDQIAKYHLDDGTFPFPQAECLAHDGKTLWVGTMFGLCRRNDNNRFVRSDNSSSLPSEIIYDLHWDGTTLWAGTHKGVAFKAPSGNFQEINELNTNHGLRNNWCRKVLRFSTWFAAVHDKGLSLWNTSFQASNPEWWKNIDHAKSAITRPINDMAYDGRHLWLATARGVMLINAPVEKFFSETLSGLINYSHIHGLPSDRVNALIALKGTLWIGTDEGLARLKDEKIQIVADVTNSAPRRIRKLAVSGDILWIGSDKGLQFINTAMVD